MDDEHSNVSQWKKTQMVKLAFNFIQLFADIYNLLLDIYLLGNL